MLIAPTLRSLVTFAAFLVAFRPVAEVALALPSKAAREYRVEFQADRVQVDADLGSLELDGNVRVQAQRYRLKSQRLRLRRGPRGVELEGEATVALCTCDAPPLELRASHTTLAPPTDALFGNLRLEAWGVPVLWLPGLWLRTPTRIGLTLPRLSYRGKDGFLAGAGGYLPLEVVDGRVSSSLTLNAGAYLRGGAALQGQLDTERSTSRVVWDHLGRSALEIDAHGSAALSEATFAYRVDALRGARASVVSSSLEAAARRTDRARLAVLQVDEFALGFMLGADAPRAGAMRDWGAIGPELSVGAARALGANAAYDLFARAKTSTIQGNQSETALFQQATLSTHLRSGPLGIGLGTAESSTLTITENRGQGSIRGGLQGRLGVPLTRAFGRVSHFIEPLVLLRGLASATPRGSEPNLEHSLLLAGGFDTALGEQMSRQAFNLSARVGALQQSDAVRFVAMARSGADTSAIGLWQSVVLLGDTSSVVSFSRLRLGATDGLQLLLKAQGQSHGSPARARVLFDEDWYAPARAFLDRNGWSAGSELSLPWTRTLTTTASLDYDLTDRELLATWGGVGYRHPCHCLAVSSFVGHRVGRGGFDAWVGIDLAP